MSLPYDCLQVGLKFFWTNLKLTLTRLESKVFSLERLLPSSPVEVSKSQTYIGSEKDFGFEKLLGPKKLLPKKVSAQKILGQKKNLC